MFFDVGWEFDCEGGCGGGFAAWSVHFGFLVSLSAMWRLVRMKRRSMSTSIFSPFFPRFFYTVFSRIFSTENPRIFYRIFAPHFKHFSVRTFHRRYSNG